MRHAKSDWGDSSLSDHDRPLNRRGHRDAPEMAKWLTGLGVIPGRVLCSSALRTCQTIRLMQERWPVETDVMTMESLYLASPETLWRSATSNGGDHECVMVLAHNPGISQLTSMMADRSIEMPTAAIAVFQLNVDYWSELSIDTDTDLVHFMSPKQL
ncbi:SixA phosphatase family protein [Rubripirellula tenax]|nr:histidine phosphatase family protein [Rubripirellula tenax]